MLWFAQTTQRQWLISQLAYLPSLLKAYDAYCYSLLILCFELFAFLIKNRIV